MPSPPCSRVKTLGPISTPATHGFIITSSKRRSPSRIFKEFIADNQSIPQGSATTTARKPAKSNNSKAVPTTQVAKDQKDPPKTFSPVPRTMERLIKARDGWHQKRSSVSGRWTKGTWEDEDIDVWENGLSPVMEEVAEGDDRDKWRASTDPGPAKKEFGDGETA